MAPGPRKSDAIDKPDSRAPHIILRTLPALSFSTPTHSFHVQLAFHPPARDKLCPMAETALETRSLTGSAFGAESLPSNNSLPSDNRLPSDDNLSSDSSRPGTAHSSNTHASIDLLTLQLIVDDLKNTQATKQDLKEVNTDVQKLTTQLNAREAASKKFEEETQERFRSLEAKLDKTAADLGKRIGDEVSSLDRKISENQTDTKKEFGRMDRNFAALNKNMGLLLEAMAKLTNEEIQIEPVELEPAPATPESPPLLFLSPGTPSPPDSTFNAPYRPPSPPSISPTSPTSRSTRSLRSRSSMVSLAESVGRRVGNRVRGIFNRAAAEAERGAVEEANNVWNDRNRDIPPVPPLPQSPQQEQPEAGPSTQSQRAPSSKEKLRLLVGQPIQRDRQE